MSDLNNLTEHLDHPPSPQELAEIYMRAEAKDPRSLLYERTLVRPKVPIWQLILLFLAMAGAGIITYFGIMQVLSNGWIATACAMAAIVLVGLLTVKQLVIALVKTYQALASAKIRNRCRYEPSCSVYMIAVLEKYGFWKGFPKGMKRWRSCKPPNGGYDLP